MREGIRFYFQLLAKLQNRRFVEFGLHPVLGYVFFALLFVGLSMLLFTKTEYFNLLYVVILVQILLWMGYFPKNELLQTTFSTVDYNLIRILENLLISIPFALILLFEKEYLFAILSPILGALLTRLNYRSINSFTIPSPFSGKPFEFTTGFRNSLFGIVASYVLVIIAIHVSNFNLGLFGVVSLTMISISFYLNPEELFYTWIYAYSPKEFIIHKLSIALIYSLLLCLPGLILLGIFFSHQLPVTLLFVIVSLVYLITIILGKYSVYPKPMSLSHGLMFVMAVLFPPFLLILLPFFYTKAIHRLQHILAS